ncbi:PAAR domain-containing protein [Leptolyngbya cf. ectocarpi LEGE 11479]|uniref:PAAR domain-containing protein n=1 Tax=Leptolyngbya cf. ectocarpi LEGE 11479 TaxID=1828722 RepID=A0A929FB27_LEPEC|nr:PAAR domain-containing protein [Leptolyngbya cf. ectocarpi LEGE 11479]
MGRPAARLGDKVVHPLPGVLGPGPGSLNVKIGGLPAWRGLPLGASLPEPPPEPEPEEDQTEEEAGAAQQAAAEEAMLAAGGGADIHACAQPSSPVTVDGPGFVTTGSTTVMINGLPACRQGDTITEILGPPNVIDMGCPTVKIGG